MRARTHTHTHTRIVVGVVVAATVVVVVAANTIANAIIIVVVVLLAAYDVADVVGIAACVTASSASCAFVANFVVAGAAAIAKLLGALM